MCAKLFIVLYSTCLCVGAQFSHSAWAIDCDLFTCWLLPLLFFNAGPILVKQLVKETTCALVVSYERNKAIAFFTHSFTHSSLVLLQYIDVSSKLLNKFHLLRLAISVRHLSFICSPLTAASLSPEDISVSTYHKGGPGNRQFQNQLEIFLLPLFLPRSFL